MMFWITLILIAISYVAIASAIYGYLDSNRDTGYETVVLGTAFWPLTLFFLVFKPLFNFLYILLIKGPCELGEVIYSKRQRNSKG